VIGGGSAGVRTARVAASLGAKVAIVEERDFGGTCVNVGCIPKKLLAYGAHAAHEIEEARAMGWRIGEASIEWRELADRTHAEVRRLNGIYETLLGSAGVEIVRGRAQLEKDASGLAVRVGERRLEARYVIVATGGRPRRPSVPGAELADVSDDFFAWTSLPRSLVVVGGGYVALEIASVVAGLGVSVDVVARSHVLQGFDEGVRAFVPRALARHGVRVHEGRGALVAIEREGDGVAVVDGLGGRTRGERVLLAVGRDPSVTNLGLESLDIAVRDGAIAVDEHYETSCPGVFAIGDVISRMELTPVALAEGMVVAHRLFGTSRAPVPYETVPTAVFSMPPVAAVGLTEERARARGHALRVFETEFRPLKHRLTGIDARTYVKIVVDAPSDRVLGIHVVGDDAPEIIQGFAVAVQMGATKAQLDATIGVHPTAAEELVTMRSPSR